MDFKIIEEFKPNEQIITLLKRRKLQYLTKNGTTKVALNTNLQFISPIIYLLTYPTKLTILEYKVNEISNKNFYIKETNKKYNLKEIIEILKEV